MATFLDHADTDRSLITTVFRQYLDDLEAAGGTFDDLVALVAGVAGDIDGDLVQAASLDGRPSAAHAALASPAETLMRNLSAINLRQTAVTLDRNDIPPTASLADILGVAIRDHMIANTITYQSRGVTHSAPVAAGGNVGDGEMLLLSTDDQGVASPIADGQDLEAVTDEELTFECVADAIAGGRDPGNETFNVRGEFAPRDVLEIGGSESSIDGFEVVNAVTAQDHISNGSFDLAFQGTGANKVASYTLDTPASVNEESTTVFRGDRCLALVGDVEISQQALNLPATGPIVVSVMLNRNGTGVTGTVDLEIGGALVSVSLASIAASGWVRLSMRVWPKQFAVGVSTDLKITLSGGASFGTGLLVDENVVSVLTRIGGRYPIILAGQVDFRQGDVITQDTAVSATPGTNKDTLHRFHGFGFELPHSLTPSIPDPP